MVFDEWHQQILVAWIFTFRCAKPNLMPWMKSLNVCMQMECQRWKPSTFIVNCAKEISTQIYVLILIWELDVIRIRVRVPFKNT